MRRSIILAALLVAGCASTPEAPVPVATAPVSTPAAPREPGTLIGLTGNELVRRFGNPALQIREGNSFKIQYRGQTCVLDAYLYPGAGGQYRVTHVDTRTPSGVDFHQPTCISALEYPG
jgi:hypothetical protein